MSYTHTTQAEHRGERFESPFPFLRSLNTGLSRAKQLLIVVGSEDAIASAVRNVKPNVRRTMLQQRISMDTYAPGPGREV